MPTPKFLAPLKDALRRDKGQDAIEDEEPELVARDFAAEPGALNAAAASDSSLPLINTDGTVQPSQSILSPEPVAAPAVPNASSSQASVNTLDARSDFAAARTARLAEQTDDEDDDDEDNALSDVQLRRLYDDEEIERFLDVFAARVTEVTLAPSAKNTRPRKAAVLRSIGEDGENEEGDEKIIVGEEDSDAETDIDEPWTYLDSSKTPSAPNTAAATPVTAATTPEPVQPVHVHRPPKYLSARVAAWIIPKLPPAPDVPHSRFKISAARFAGQRVYVSTYPVYAPFVADLIQLAAWADWNRSARVCAAWWLFWLFNLLLPALLGKILFSLLRRRLTPFPNLAELRQRRRLTREADELSDAMEGPSAATSFLGAGPMPGIGAGGGDMGVRDMWKLVKLVTKGKGKKGKEKLKEAGDAVAEQTGISLDAGAGAQNQADEDWRDAMLGAMEGIADFHERVRNLWLWRREQSSRIYAFVLTLLVLFTALTPAHILAKLTYATIGILYWFVVPVIMAMPSSALKRIPAPLCDVPTDAEYAMGIMSARVASGESVVPASRRKARQHGRARRFIANMSMDSITSGGADGTKKSDQDVESMKAEANEKEAAAAEERAATAGDIRALKSEGLKGGDAPDGHPAKVGTLDRLKNQWEASKVELLGGKDDSNASIQSIAAPQTVPANHKATPGTLSLDSESICFTPLLAHTPRLRIELEKIQGVKKTGRTNGLRIRHLADEGDEREVVFRFIPSRDEIFGKLVGWGGKRWLKV
ncbi:hypothetical protein BDV93DRAFT_545347 [Ceratobasidium sp. AG-I]|nr:hypothetical protein BDV93DRAFT_545347 [Ceratobasidium sp. AG-I]